VLSATANHILTCTEIVLSATANHILTCTEIVLSATANHILTCTVVQTVVTKSWPHLIYSLLFSRANRVDA
jgi:hypothetical protein